MIARDKEVWWQVLFEGHNTSIKPSGRSFGRSVGEQDKTQILQDLGYDTTWAANAEEALDRLGADGGDFDVVFSDVVMPGTGEIEMPSSIPRFCA